MVLLLLFLKLFFRSLVILVKRNSESLLPSAKQRLTAGLLVGRKFCFAKFPAHPFREAMEH